MKRDTTASQELVGSENVGAVGIAAKGEHRRMLEEKQDVADEPLLAEFNKLRLEAQGIAVVDAAEIEGMNHGLL